MTRAERLQKLQVLAIDKIYLDPNPVEKIESLDGKVDDYLLLWPNSEQQALICARTGNITTFFRVEGEFIKKHSGSDIPQGCDDDIDARIEELEKMTQTIL